MAAERIPGNGQQREILKDVVPLEAPFTINVVTSTVCNFKCNYCVHSLGILEKENLGFKPALMKWEMFCEIIEQILLMKKLPKVIFLYGVGEPLCNPELPRMVKYIKERCPEVKVAFISNGLLLNEQLIDSLVEAGLDTIRISIQGLSSQKYQEVCGVSIDYEKFLETLSYLYNHKKQCQVYIKVIDVALEEGEDKRFYNTFENIADRVFIEKCMPIFEGVEYEKEIRDRVTTDRYGNEHKMRQVCPMTFFTLSIMPDGKVRPCYNFKTPVLLGNIKEKSLANIWSSEELRSFWMQQLKKERYKNVVCNLCVAPDDVSQKSDELDDVAEIIMKRLNA